jgi:hypothetical protein
MDAAYGHQLGIIHARAYTRTHARNPLGWAAYGHWAKRIVSGRMVSMMDWSCLGLQRSMTSWITQQPYLCARAPYTLVFVCVRACVHVRARYTQAFACVRVRMCVCARALYVSLCVRACERVCAYGLREFAMTSVMSSSAMKAHWSNGVLLITRCTRNDIK